MRAGTRLTGTPKPLGWFLRTVNRLATHCVKISDLRAQLRSINGRIYVPIQETPHYRYLQGETEPLEEYLLEFFYSGDRQTCREHLIRFEKLSQVLRYGAPYRRRFHWVEAQQWRGLYVILNGVHRASIIASRGEKELGVRLFQNREDLDKPNRSNY